MNIYYILFILILYLNAKLYNGSGETNPVSNQRLFKLKNKYNDIKECLLIKDNKLDCKDKIINYLQIYDLLQAEIDTSVLNELITLNNFQLFIKQLINSFSQSISTKDIILIIKNINNNVDQVKLLKKLTINDLNDHIKIILKIFKNIDYIENQFKLLELLSRETLDLNSNEILNHLKYDEIGYYTKEIFHLFSPEILEKNLNIILNLLKNLDDYVIVDFFEYVHIKHVTKSNGKKIIEIINKIQKEVHIVSVLSSIPVEILQDNLKEIFSILFRIEKDFYIIQILKVLPKNLTENEYLEILLLATKMKLDKSKYWILLHLPHEILNKNSKYIMNILRDIQTIAYQVKILKLFHNDYFIFYSKVKLLQEYPNEILDILEKTADDYFKVELLSLFSKSILVHYSTRILNLSKTMYDGQIVELWKLFPIKFIIENKEKLMDIFINMKETQYQAQLLSLLPPKELHLFYNQIITVAMSKYNDDDVSLLLDYIPHKNLIKYSEVVKIIVENNNSENTRLKILNRISPSILDTYSYEPNKKKLKQN